MSTVSFSDLIQGKNASDILSFNFCPLDWVHPSWQESMNFSEFLAWGGTQHGKRLAQKFLLQKMNLYSCYEFNFVDKLSQIALLSYENLELLAVFIGMIRYSEYLERINYKIEIPDKNNEKQYQYFIRFIAPYFLQQKAYENLSIEYERLKAKSVVYGDFICEGATLLFYLLSVEPEAVTRRIIYKLPKDTIESNIELYPVDFNSLSIISTKISYLITDEINS